MGHVKTNFYLEKPTLATGGDVLCTWLQGKRAWSRALGVGVCASGSVGVAGSDFASSWAVL